MKPLPLKITTLIAALAVALLALSCGSDDGGPVDGGGTGGGDTTAPGITSVTALDENTIVVVFDEDVDRPTAEYAGNYTIVETMVPKTAIPGDTIETGSAALGTDNRTVTISTFDPMGNVPYNLFVSGVKDDSGNAITSEISALFTGSNASDTTPPTITSRTPSPGATNVAVGQSVIVTFSEPMDYSSVVAAFSWTFGGGSVVFNVENDNNVFAFVPTIPLALGTTYSVTIAGTATDWAGNPLTATNWSFTTRSSADTTPPTFLSSTPANGATNVSTDVTLVLRFSEPIDQTSIDVLTSPSLDNGVLSFTNGGATLNFDPIPGLLDNTQYNLLIPPGGVKDLSGNGIENAVSITFTTGASLATGSVSGTVSGDPSSSTASSAAGALVIVSTFRPFSTQGDDIIVAGQTTANAGGMYTITHLDDGYYWPISVLDSNDDGLIDPDGGDAIGAYGADFSGGGPITVDSVLVTGGGSVTGADFQLYDQSVISGSIGYIGSLYDASLWRWYVGVFDTTGFDLSGPLNSLVDVSGQLPFDSQYRAREEDGLVDGVYYVGGFLDVNDDGFDPGDPFMLYGGADSPTPIDIAAGSDGVNIDLLMEDPPSAAITVGPWTTNVSRPPSRPGVDVLYRFVREALSRR